MTTRLPISVAVLAAAIAVFHQPKSVWAQSQQLQIASISLGPPQTLSYPTGPVDIALAASQYLYFFPDERMTILPPASGSGPYLMFAAGTLSTTGLSGTAVLQSTDLQNWTFATGLGYQPLAIVPPVNVWKCNPTYDSTSFDENYAGSGFVAQDPTLPAGNLVMLYEAENDCPGGVSTTSGGNVNLSLHSVAIARSSDNGMTWPAPVNNLTGGPTRYPVLQSSTSMPGVSGAFDQIPSGLVDKSLDGNYYLYAAYNVEGSPRIARAQLGQNPLSFQKWYNGSFSQPGIGGMDSALPWFGSCISYDSGINYTLGYVDDIGVYLLMFTCEEQNGANWYYATASSMDLQDWTTAQPIPGAQFASLGSASGACDGSFPSLMSPGEPPGHLHLTGTVFYLCDNGSASEGGRLLTSRTFTINTQPQPAPVLNPGSLANGATYLPGGLVPGSFAQVLGTGLSNATRNWTGLDFLNLGNNLPTSLSGVQVMVNNIPAPVYYISPTQIDFQVPNGVSGTASVQVIVNGTPSNIVTASASDSSPGLFLNPINGVFYPSAYYASGITLGPSGVPGDLPASVGYHIQLWATGLTTEPAGVLATASPISGVTVTVGSVTVPADYAGQTQYAGVFQVNFTVPQQFANMPAGNYPISIALNGVSSPSTINSSPIVIPMIP